MTKFSKSDIADYQMLAKCVNTFEDLPEDWIQVGKTYNNEQTGFRGKIYKNITSNEIVLSFGATDTNKKDRRDIRNDVFMALDKLPPQIINAISLYKECKKMFPNNTLTITGYSLGGSLAQIMGFKTGEKTVTFNAYGTGNMLNTNKSCENILNIGNSEDFVFMSNINNHIGLVSVSPNKSGNIMMPKFTLSSNNHKIENICIIDLVDYKKGSVKSFVDKVEDGERHGELKNVKKVANQYFDKNKKGVQPTVLKGFVTNDNGHWVTIDGNHVLIKD